jgi:hypothetical protein
MRWREKYDEEACSFAGLSTAGISAGSRDVAVRQVEL